MDQPNGDVEVFIDAMRFRVRPSTGEVWVWSHRTCHRDSVLTLSEFDWRPISGPDPEILGESLYREVTEQVPLPSPAMSPVGPGFVNLGMWLAVDEVAPVLAEARAGAVWARTTAELVSTSFDMGNGDVVQCDGVGDPIPDAKLDSVEESPVCGYTYADVSAEGAYTVTITSTWRIGWTSSTGAGGDLGTMDRTMQMVYEVREIQTVGSP